jgi:hypothetical protein
MVGRGHFCLSITQVQSLPASNTTTTTTTTHAMSLLSLLFSLRSSLPLPLPLLSPLLSLLSSQDALVFLYMVHGPPQKITKFPKMHGSPYIPGDLVILWVRVPGCSSWMLTGLYIWQMVWTDSTRVFKESSQVAFSGPPLKNGQTCLYVAPFPLCSHTVLSFKMSVVYL